MLRFSIFIISAFLAAAALAWLVDRPGLVSIDWQEFRIEASLMVALLAIAALFAVLAMTLGILRLLVGGPRRALHALRGRRETRGNAALGDAIIALGGSDIHGAMRLANKARQLLADGAAAQLLIAQATDLAGQTENAHHRYEALLEQPRLKPAALFALFEKARLLGDGAAQRYYALEAQKLVPSPDWADRAALAIHAADGDWLQALAILEKLRSGKMIGREAWKKQKAALLTGAALAMEPSDPSGAREHAAKALKLEPGLAPAAIVVARLAVRQGEIRKATKTLEAAWRETGHPEIADAYLYVRPGDSARDRLRRARRLAAIRAPEPAAMLSLAVAALDSGDWEEARAQLSAAAERQPSRKSFVMMARLEREEHGDAGREREYLSRALVAADDPTWCADDIAYGSWAAVAPGSGRIGAFEWRQPKQPERPAISLISNALPGEHALPAEHTQPGERDADTHSADAALTEKTGDSTEGGDPAGNAENAPPNTQTSDVAAVAPELPAQPPEHPEHMENHVPEPAAAVASSLEKSRDDVKPGHLTDDRVTDDRVTDDQAKARTQTLAAEQESDAAPTFIRANDFPLRHMPDDPGPGGGDESGESDAIGRRGKEK